MNVQVLFSTMKVLAIQNVQGITFMRESNRSCVLTCPEGLIENTTSKKCEEEKVKEETYDDFINNIVGNISDLANNLSIIESSNSTAQIYKESDAELAEADSIKSGLSALNFKECFSTLHTVYNIPSTEDLILILVV